MGVILPQKELAEMFEGIGAELSSADYSLFERYAELLVDWNTRMNLTGITDPQGISEKHFLDSVMPFYFEKARVLVPSNATLIDVGTGAGFPSCPLKILRNDIRLTLLDSLNKRINFLKAVSDELGLDAECVHARAEDAGAVGAPLRESFDVATARAVAGLPVLCEYCLPFVRVGGAFFALKGSDCFDEISASKRAISTLGGEVAEVFEYTLPSGDRRTLIIVRKVSQTPTKYPRNKAQMNKSPL